MSIKLVTTITSSNFFKPKLTATRLLWWAKLQISSTCTKSFTRDLSVITCESYLDFKTPRVHMQNTLAVLRLESYFKRSTTETWTCWDALFSNLKLAIPSKNTRYPTFRMTDPGLPPNLCHLAFSARSRPQQIAFRQSKNWFHRSSNIDRCWAKWLKRPKTKKHYSNQPPVTEWKWGITLREFKEKSLECL